MNRVTLFPVSVSLSLSAYRCISSACSYPDPSVPSLGCSCSSVWMDTLYQGPSPSAQGTCPPASTSLDTSIIANRRSLEGLSFCKLDVGRGGSDFERPKMVASRACCHLGEHMASNRVLRGLDPVHMPIPVSKTIFIWVCTPLVAVRFSASGQLVCSNLLVIVVTVAGSGPPEVSRGRRKELEKE